MLELESYLNAIEIWMKQNHLKMNAGKTQVVILLAPTPSK